MNQTPLEQATATAEDDALIELDEIMEARWLDYMRRNAEHNDYMRRLTKMLQDRVNGPPSSKFQAPFALARNIKGLWLKAALEDETKYLQRKATQAGASMESEMAFHTELSNTFPRLSAWKGAESCTNSTL